MSPILVQGVKNIHTTEKTRYLSKTTQGSSFEVRLEFPCSQLTTTLNHTDIRTVMKPSVFNLQPIFEFVQEEFNLLQNDPKYEEELECVIHRLLNDYDLTMNMTVEYHFFGNLKATSVEVISATKV